MRHFILLICFLWVSPCFAGWNPYVIGSGTVAGTTYGYAGYANTSGTPDSNPSTIFGTSGDRTFCHPWTASEAGTAESINLYIGTNINSNNLTWVTLFNGNTLVGYGVVPSSTTHPGWSGYITLTVVGGQSLAFSSSDSMCIGFQYDFSNGGRTDSANNGTAGIVSYKYQDVAIDGSPQDVSSLLTSSSEDMGIILKYAK